AVAGDRCVAATAAGGLVEAACAPSPAYFATMYCGPAVVGVSLPYHYTTLFRSESEQLVKGVAAPSAKKFTSPVGKGAVATESVTVAVEHAGLPTGTAGSQTRPVAVECLLAVTPVVPELPSCVVSPP